MRLPELKFSQWFGWTKRDYIPGIGLPGVYILANFDKNPGRKVADPLDKQVIYVGETTRNSLRGRWRQFHRSAFQSRDGHSGGKTYRKEVGGDGSDLYVAAFPVENLPEGTRAAFIKSVERRLILDYATTWGGIPKCNKS